MVVTAAPTMAGFVWSTSSPQPIAMPVPGNGWCVRDAICQLLGWPVGSDDWAAFTENPEGPDLYHLISHLGLEWYDPLSNPYELGAPRGAGLPGRRARPVVPPVRRRGR